MNDLMLSRLKDLKLSGIIKTLEIRNEQAIKDNISSMEFIELLISGEISNRLNNGMKKGCRRLRFLRIKLLRNTNLIYNLQ
ncbi:MAG: hypothetical protein PWP27_2620 [Clostridiales bacterium]|nr:hypothetical protein [Clostridiales bacterium]MDK2934810.1 hypothetical protein [Clostridiales bacterium]